MEIGNIFLNRTPPIGQLTYSNSDALTAPLGHKVTTIRSDNADTAARKIKALRNAGRASTPTESPIIAMSMAIPTAEHIALPVRNVAFALPYTCSGTSESAALFSGAKVKPIALSLIHI